MSKVDDDSEITLELTEEEISHLDQLKEKPGRGEIYGQMSIALGGRKNQQDSVYLQINDTHNIAFAIVCDGMGGLQGGEVASQEAVKEFAENFSAVNNEDNYYYFLKSEALKADQKVAMLEDQEGNPLDAGSTLVATVIKNGMLQWISVGDSKIYIIRGGQMVSVAKEHNYLNLLNEQLLGGEISEEEYAREQVRGAALTSYIGMGNLSLMELNYEPLPLMNDDIILLCSDGLYKAMSEDVIRQIILENPYDIQNTLLKLQEEARRRSVRIQDNTTIIMMLYKENFMQRGETK